MTHALKNTALATRLAFIEQCLHACTDGCLLHTIKYNSATLEAICWGSVRTICMELQAVLSAVVEVLVRSSRSLLGGSRELWRFPNKVVVAPRRVDQHVLVNIKTAMHAGVPSQALEIVPYSHWICEQAPQRQSIIRN